MCNFDWHRLKKEIGTSCACAIWTGTPLKLPFFFFKQLCMCNFDWHRLKKEIGIDKTVRGLWERLTPMLGAQVCLLY
jgi:hypothetical protein